MKDSSEHIDCVVIGAGVVGLAVARELGQAGREVLVLEASSIIGSGTSSRNSEVIHAGIYYARDSLKARLCVAGKKRLYDYCKSRGVAHQRCGKLIVATNAEQQATLQGIAQKASNNGVDDLQLLSRSEVQAMEPEINAVAALLSPSTGIVDSHSLMLSLQGEAEEAGAMVAFGSTVTGLQARHGKVQLSVDAAVDAGATGEGIETMHLEANTVINSAGLGALGITRDCEALPAAHQPRQVLAKGNYFSLACKAPVSRLIYPVPETGGLGVHITLDLAGRVRFGPDVQWIDKIDYHVDPQRAEAFYAAIRTYWPDLPDGSLMPEYAGVRPKIAFGKEPSADFMISGPPDHGVPGLVNLFGIESPGLTSSLAIAAEVHELTRVL